MTAIEFEVNGKPTRLTVDPRTTLLEALRDMLSLRGTKYGCGEGECGACTVVVDGNATCACLATLGSVHGRQVTTIEGLANDPVGTAVINGFKAAGAVQCGFCTPGFIMTAAQHLKDGGGIGRVDVETALAGNLCRCTGYIKIHAALRHAGTALPAPAPRHARPRLDKGAYDDRRHFSPSTLAAALDFLRRHPETIVLAGGTDLLVSHEHRLREVTFVDIGRIGALKGVALENGHLRIGPATSWSQIAASPLVGRHAPSLAAAAREIGGVQIQNAGTIGGNIANASPAGDGLPPLYVHDAEIVTAGTDGEECEPISSFITGPRRTRLRKGRLITGIRIPLPSASAPTVSFFRKIGERKAQTISKASIAFHGELSGRRFSAACIAVGAAGPTVIRAHAAEENLMAREIGEQSLRETAHLISRASSPIDDLRSTAAYRRHVLAALFEQGMYDAGCMNAFGGIRD